MACGGFRRYIFSSTIKRTQHVVRPFQVNPAISYMHCYRAYFFFLFSRFKEDAFFFSILESFVCGESPFISISNFQPGIASYSYPKKAFSIFFRRPPYLKRGAFYMPCNGLGLCEGGDFYHKISCVEPTSNLVKTFIRGT